jgi:hypothetical protein
LQGGTQVVQKKTMTNTKTNRHRRMILNEYPIEALVYGETSDPTKPAYIAIGGNCIKATIDEFFKVHQKSINQARRFGRQLKVKEMTENDKS